MCGTVWLRLLSGPSWARAWHRACFRGGHPWRRGARGRCRRQRYGDVRLSPSVGATGGVRPRACCVGSGQASCILAVCDQRRPSPTTKLRGLVRPSPLAPCDQLRASLPAPAAPAECDHKTYSARARRAALAVTSTSSRKHGWGTSPRTNSEIHIDVSHSRQPLVKGERVVRYEVNTVMLNRLTSRAMLQLSCSHWPPPAAELCAWADYGGIDSLHVARQRVHHRPAGRWVCCYRQCVRQARGPSPTRKRTRNSRSSNKASHTQIKANTTLNHNVAKASCTSALGLGGPRPAASRQRQPSVVPCSPLLVPSTSTHLLSVFPSRVCCALLAPSLAFSRPVPTTLPTD